MPASEELRDGTVDDDFESCDEGEGEASGNELHAGQTHGLESIAAARPKSQRVASQAAAKRRQHPSTSGAPEGPAGPAEAYTKLQLEEKLAAVQFLFTRELDKVVKLCQEKHDQLQQELQQERARCSSLADRVAALEAASQQLPQPQEDLRAQVEAFKVDTKHVQEDLRRQLEANEVRDRAPCLMMFGLQEQHAADGQALHGAVTQELVQSAGPHGFTSSSVASAVRWGRPNPDRARPRPVLIRCSTVGGKYQAFRGRQDLRARARVTIDEYLTSAQMKRRADQQEEFDRLRHVPGANPHWRHGDILYRWENNQAVPHVPPAPDAQASPVRPAAPARGGRRPSAGGSPPRGAGVARSAARAAGTTPSASTPPSSPPPSRPRA